MAVKIFTDGAATPRNPGNGGAASIILYGKDKLIVTADYVGYKVTSNHAELSAIRNALRTFIEEVGNLDEQVILYSDSSYSLEVIAGDYKARSNYHLVKETREYLRQLNNIKLFWIRSHRSLKRAKDETTRELILWNSYVDIIATKSSKQGPGYSHTGRMSIQEFRDKFTKVEN